MSTLKVGDRVKHRYSGVGAVVESDGTATKVAFDETGAAEWCDTRNISLIDADAITHPPHYTQHPSGVECIDVAEHFSFCLGNVVKYVWRAGRKGDAIEDLKKAKWYLDREIANRENEAAK